MIEYLLQLVFVVVVARRVEGSQMEGGSTAYAAALQVQGNLLPAKSILLGRRNCRIIHCVVQGRATSATASRSIEERERRALKQLQAQAPDPCLPPRPQPPLSTLRPPAQILINPFS